MRHFLSILIVSLVTTFAYSQEEKPLILGTASMISDMATNIFGDKANVQNIVPIGGDPHMFEPTPKSAQTVNKANLVLMNGLTFEGWLMELVENSGTKAKVITTTEGVDVISSVDYANSSDPHAWMNAANAVIYSDNIRKAAIELLPEHTDYFNANFEKYKAELEALDQYIIDQINSIPEQQRVLITSHDAFQYYGRKYGIRLESAMGTSTEADAQTSDIMQLNKTIKETGVPAIFVESTINPKLIEQVATDNNIIIGGELFADSLGDEESGADTYIKMMRQNTDKIANALKQEKKAPEAISAEESSFDAMTTGILGIIVLLLLAFFALRRKR